MKPWRTCSKQVRALDRIRSIFAQALPRSWLFLHIPPPFALIAALAPHLSVFSTGSGPMAF